MTHRTNQAEPVVRERTDTDLAGAAKALVEVYAADGYPVEGVDQPEAWLQPEGLIRAWVAVMNGKIVGHVGISQSQGEEAVKLYLDQEPVPEDQVTVLARLFVHPEARKRAIGKKLLVAVYDYAQQHGLRIVGEAMAKDKTAIRLYERLGCRILGETTHHYGDGQETPAVCFAAPSA
jgi:ribosomal protein S18 acetylase RimI-like enzyme